MKSPRNAALFAHPFLPWSTFGMRMPQMSAVARLALRVLAPVHRKATANAKWLAKKVR